MFGLGRRFHLLILALLVAGPWRAAAASEEKTVFSAAALSFQNGFYDRAEKEFGDFVQQFPASPRIPEALLFEAKARLAQTNYSGALEILLANESKAGKLADEYLFSIGRAYLLKNDLSNATASFDRFLHQFPASTNCLKAAINEAGAYAGLKDWPHVLAVLEQPAGVFQSVSRTNSSDEMVARGFLLLGEADFATTNYPAAEKALQNLAKWQLAPPLAWRRQYWLCRVQYEEGHFPEALLTSTNLLSLASAAGQRELEAQSAALQGTVLEKMGKLGEAIRAYTNNLAAGIAPEWQAQAISKSTELFLALTNPADAAGTLEGFVTNNAQSPKMDLALLALGELRLRQYLGAVSNAGAAADAQAAASNHLNEAVTSLTKLVTGFPQSDLAGKAGLDLGWCWWLQDKWPQSASAFSGAITKLPHSFDLATAHFKLGDALFQQTNYPGALTNYTAVTQTFADLPEVKSKLFEPALYQSVRAALAAGKLEAATNSLAQLLTLYPSGFHAGGALLLTGQELAAHATPAAARAIFQDYLKRAGEGPLLPQVSLAVARTYEQEENWPEAINEYDSWLKRFPASSLRPRAEYFLGMAYFYAGHETNAFVCLTNFVAHFRTNELAPSAQWWVADYYMRTGQYQDAEINYKPLFQDPKDPLSASDLAWPARLMAGRAALLCLRRGDAMEHFTNLTSNAKCPVPVWLEAMFALGDLYMNGNSTNKTQDYEQAIKYFSQICSQYPSNHLAVLAMGERACCYLQLVGYTSNYQTAATNFQQVLTSPLADFTTRSIARVGLGLICEKEAEQTPAQRQALLKTALGHYQDVFYEKDLRPGETPDPFWVKRGGLDTARLAEALGEFAPAIQVYKALEEKIPPLTSSLEAKIRQCEKLAAAAGK